MLYLDDLYADDTQVYVLFLMMNLTALYLFQKLKGV